MDIYTAKVDEKILFLGEGNFSFCVDFIKFNDSKFVNNEGIQDFSEIIATCFESSVTVSEIKKCNINFLKERGVTVLFDIDATCLKNYSTISCKRFSKIIFNFPHVGGKMKIHLNRKLVADFFLSAKDVLDEKGSILLTLCDGQGGTDADKNKRRWDDTWKIVEMAAEANFALKNVYPFSPECFPGYISTGFRSLEKGFNTESALTHIFQIGESLCIENLSDIDVLFHLEKVTTSFGTEEVSKIHSKKILQNPFRNKYTAQTCLYNLIKSVQFDKDIKFCDDFNLIYGFSCRFKSSRDLIREHLSLFIDYAYSVRVFEGLFLNRLTDNLLHQPVCCDIICVGSESYRYSKHIVCELLKLFNFPLNILNSDSQLGNDELYYLAHENRFDVLKISRLVSFDNSVDVCTIFLDNLAIFLFKLKSWHELWAEGARTEIDKFKLITPCLFPCTYTFDLSLSAPKTYLEENFYRILWHIAGNIVFNVKLVSTYQLPDTDNKNFCYRISYRSYEVPLYRKQVINIQQNIIGAVLKRLLRVTIL